jgi:hypothetical protein
MESDALAGLHMDEEDGVVALVAHGLRVRVNEPGLFDRVGYDKHHFAIRHVGELEGLLDDGDVPTEKLLAFEALFTMLALVLAVDVADAAVAIGLLILTETRVERIGEDAAVLIDVSAQRGIEGVGAIIGWAGGGCGLLGGKCRHRGCK